MEVEVEKDSSKAVPQRVMEAVNNTLVDVQELSANFEEFLSLSHTEVLAELPPLQRAQSLLTLARATSTLFAVRLRCTGVHPDEHRLKGDLERVSRYQDKLERYLRLSKAPLRPSTTLNFQAANRFIEHSLPDLTAEQRRSLREIRRNEAGRINYIERNVRKKRKYQTPEKQEKPPVQASVQEFLEKAAYELFDHKQRGHKEPIVPILIEDSSSEEEDEEEKELEEEKVEENEEQEVKGAPDLAPALIIIDSSDEN